MPKNKLPRASTGKGTINWDKQFRFDVEYAKRMLMERGEVMPMFVVHGEKRTIVILTPWTNNDEKQYYRNIVRLMGVAENADGLTFIGEAWMRRVAKRDRETQQDYDERTKILPSQAEDRIEVIMVMTQHRDGKGSMAVQSKTLEIKRGANGKPSGTCETLPKDESSLGMDGPMTELLLPVTPLPHIREHARVLLDAMRGSLYSVEIGRA